jgi:hypothetical protein
LRINIAMEQVPDYAAQPLKRFFEYWEDSRRLLEVSMEGMSTLKSVPTLLKDIGALTAAVRAALPTHYGAEQKALISEKHKRDADFSEKEIKAGFPLLHAHTLVGAWGALEAAIEDMLVGILINEPEHLQDPGFSKIKIPLADYEALDKEDRMRFLLDEIGRSHPFSRKNGVDAFESLFELFLLSGAVNADVKAAIWEISHIRNVIVHRNSIADRRLVKNCPHLNIKAGEKVVITNQQLDRYGRALCEYVSAILCRLEERYGQDLDAASAQTT